MQMQRKKIKGFSLIDLVVVIAIIGIISTLGFEPFQKWRTDRIARAAAVKVSGLIQDIYSQVQRGHYSFAQFRVHLEGSEDDKTWIISSYGMETIMWNDQGYPINAGGEASKKLTVSSYEIDDKLSIGVPGNELAEGTVCFSKDGSYYAAGGMFLSGSGGMGGGDSAIVGEETSVIEEMYVCQRESVADSCSLSTGQENFYSIKWSRFGNIDMQKLN